MRKESTRSFIRLMQRSIVLFPAPLGPMMAVISCSGTSMLTPSITRLLP